MTAPLSDLDYGAQVHGSGPLHLIPEQVLRAMLYKGSALVREARWVVIDEVRRASTCSQYTNQ